MSILRQSDERRNIVRNMLGLLGQIAPLETGQAGRQLSIEDIMINEASTDSYVIGLIDMLKCLGVIEATNDKTTIQISSIQAGYFIQLLILLLDTQKPLIGEWSSKGVTIDVEHPFSKGVDFLKVIEQRRLEIDPESPPLRETVAAIGIIAQRRSSNAPRHLLFWDRHAHMWQFVGGKSDLHDTSLRTTMLRELKEELECDALIEDIHIRLVEVGQPFIIQRISPTYGILTKTTFQAFVVHFLELVPVLHAGIRWVSEAEIYAGQTSDGQPIASEPFYRLIEQSSVDLDKLYTPGHGHSE